MSLDTGEGGALSEQEKQELFQDLLSGYENGPLQPYLAKARWICPSINPFLDLSRVFYAGLPRVAPEDQDDEDQEDNDYTEEEVKAFDAIMKLERGFNTVLSACAGDVRHLLALITKISSSATGLRSDDTAKLKSSILAFIHEDPKTGSIYAANYDVEILLPSDIKDMRGFKHVDTAAHLCPLRLKAKFNEDPFCFMDRVEDGSIQITEEFFPSFLYETDTLYDKDNEDLGLFRGYLLVRVYRHIFTGPSSAMNPTAKVNKSKARKFKLTKVTGRTIAYASVQTYIALASMSQWKSYDNLFSLQRFYDNIIALFELDPQDPWVIDTLEWWDGQVPGLQQTVSKHKKRPLLLNNNTLSNPVDRILAQRVQHAVSVTRNQENVDQPEQQAPRLISPQTDQGNYHQNRQSSQHSHHQQPHSWTTSPEHNGHLEDDENGLHTDTEEAEDQEDQANLPVSETVIQDSQAAAKRKRRETAMESELTGLEENLNSEHPKKRRQTRALATVPITGTRKGTTGGRGRKRK